MGRYRSCITTNQTPRIKLSMLLKLGFIQKGKISEGSYSWTDGSSIALVCHYTDKEQYIRLIYILNSWSSEKSEYDYKIHLTFVPSNLGRGNIPYFVCPETGNRCRILYRVYGSPIWKSREAYNTNIYYPTQTSSKLSKYNDEYWLLDKQIKYLKKGKRNQTHYNGKPTRRYIRMKRLINKQKKADYLRWLPEYMPISVRKVFTDSKIE